MKLTKFLCLFLMLAVVFSFVACGKKNNGDNNNNNDGSNTPATTTYTVEFDSAGGSEVASQTVESGKLATEPAAPTKEGYNFVGWFLGETQWNFAENTVTQAITLIAKWDKVNVTPDPKPEPTKYTITYMDGETVLALTPNEYTSESTGLTLPAGPAKAHYDFVGWYSDAACENKVESIDVTAGANLTLYASYIAKTYKIFYELDNGVNAASNPNTYTVESIPTIAEPTRDGYNFLGWFTDSNCTVAFEGITLDNAGSLELYAKWEKVIPTYSITYVVNGEEVDLQPATYQTSASGITLPTPTVEDGYAFLGWLLGDQVVFSIPANTSGDLVLTAKIEADVTTYNVVYMLDGKEWQVQPVNNAADFSDYLVPEVAGYEFSGWTVLGGATAGTIPAGNEDDVTVYGTLKAITYTITYIVDDVVVSLTPATYQISDTATQLPAVPAKVGYTVLGWYNANDEKVTEIAAGATGNLVLTAKYQETVYSITYHLNGGENDERNEASYKPGQSPTLYNPLNRDGYLFQGWYTSADYVGNPVTDFSELPEGDVVLYAKWIPASNDGGNSTLTPEVPF